MSYNIKHLVSLTESTNLEFKENYSDDIIRTLSSFANGFHDVPSGTVIIGIDKNRKIVGFRGDIDFVQTKITDLCRTSCEPPISPKITIEEVENKKVVVIEVQKSNKRPHRYKGICYIRLGSTTRQTTPDEEHSIWDENITKKFDENIFPDATIDDLNTALVLEYYRSTRSAEVFSTDERNINSIIQGLGLANIDKGILRPTVAAILVFGKNPQKFFPLSSVNAIRFRGNSLADQQLDRKEICGTLDSIIRGSVNFIRQYSSIGSIISGDSIKRLDITEYPLVAIREVIANAVTHRDYTDRGSQIDLYMFDDRIEIKNPGTLGGGITIDDLKNQTGKRWLRNPAIAGYLLELKYIEKAGTGIPRIFKVLKDNGSPEPEFFADSSSVKVILRAHPNYAAKRKFEEGLLAKDRGEYDKSREYFKQALKIRPDFIEALIALAVLEGDMGNLEEARKLYGDSLKINPRNSVVYLNWAIVEERNGHTSEARVLYNKGIELDPNNINILHSWANLEKKLGSYPKAKELFEKATNLDPSQSRNWQSLGQLEIKCGRYDESERYLLTALRVAKDDYSKAWILSDLAFALSHLRRPETEIQQYYEDSLKINRNSALTNHNYAEFLRKIGKTYLADKHDKIAEELGWMRGRKPRRR